MFWLSLFICRSIQTKSCLISETYSLLKYFWNNLKNPLKKEEGNNRVWFCLNLLRQYLPHGTRHQRQSIKGNLLHVLTHRWENGKLLIFLDTDHSMESSLSKMCLGCCSSRLIQCFLLYYSVHFTSFPNKASIDP